MKEFFIILMIFGAMISCKGKESGTFQDPISEQQDTLKQSDPIPYVFPENTWVVKSPGSVGVDSVSMMDALNYLQSGCGSDGTNEVVIIKDGYLIYQGHNASKTHGIWSCTKSFTSTALGLLIEEGKCNLDDFACKYDTLLTRLYPKVELRHFASMSSGYQAVGDERWGHDSHDWSATPYVPDTPMFAPGAKFVYWDEAQMMFGRVLTEIANEDIYDYLDDKIMKTIGVSWSWDKEGSVNGHKISNGCAGVNISALDLARVGYLFLRNGNWKDQQLVPKEWISLLSQTQAPADGEGINYGYNWWLSLSMPDTPQGTFYMNGFNNNMCYVIPEWNMVFVRMGLDGNPSSKSRLYNEVFKRLKVTP